MANEAHPVAFPQVQVNVLEGFHHHHIALVAANNTAGGAEEGLFEGAGAGIEDGEVYARIVSVDGDFFGAGDGFSHGQSLSYTQ